MNNQLMILETTGRELLNAGLEYARWSEEFQNKEEKYKLIRAEAMESAVVANLPNQAQREAKLDVVLQSDERFSQIYIEYLRAKLESKKAWIMFDVRKELNENARSLVNNLTFSKDTE